MLKARAYLFLLPLALTAPHAGAAKALSVNFTVSNAPGFSGIDTASLTVTGHAVSGTVNVITPTGTYPCAVNAGSTDINNKLKLTCTVGPLEVVSFTGKWSAKSGFGTGSFFETFCKVTGAYAAKMAK